MTNQSNYSSQNHHSIILEENSLTGLIGSRRMTLIIKTTGMTRANEDDENENNENDEDNTGSEGKENEKHNELKNKKGDGDTTSFPSLSQREPPQVTIS